MCGEPVTSVQITGVLNAFLDFWVSECRNMRIQSFFLDVESPDFLIKVFPE